MTIALARDASWNDIIAASDLGLMIVSPSGGIRAIAGGARECLGLGPSDPLPGDLAAIVRSTDDEALSNDDVLALLQTGTAARPVECRLRRADGGSTRVAASVSQTDSSAYGDLIVSVTSIESQCRQITAAAKELDHLSYALDATGQGVWDYNGETDFWYFSPAWKRMRGIPETENYVSTGDDWLDNVHPDDREMVRVATARQYAGELTDVAFEYRERHRDGHWIWLQARGRTMQGLGDGKPLRIVGTDTDVTALRNSQAALGELERSELRWKIAVDSAEQGVWDHDLVTGERYYSATWRAMRGLGPDDPPPADDEQWLARVHPDDRDRVALELQRSLAGDLEHVSLEYRERHEAGGWIWILRRGKPVSHDSAGRPTRFIGTDTGVSDLKSRELEFEALSRRLEMALSTSTVGVWETDLTSGEALWDARTAELFGLPPRATAVPPGTWENLVHPEDRARTLEICAEGLATDRGYACDYRIKLPNGVIRHVRCRAAIVTVAGVGEKIIGVNWDVSQDLEQAEALRNAKQLAEARSRDLEAAHQRMEHASLHDSLTGLPNRRYLDNALAAFVEKGDTNLVLLHIDLDRFKHINDTKGHAAGDALLVHVAALLRRNVGANDIVARIGGDEFVVLIAPAPEPDALQVIVDRIIADAARPMEWNGQECRSGVSIGIAEPRPGVGARQLLINADIALYRAKRAGRNCACRFTDSLHDEIVSKKQCADDILKGLERREFEPWYQLQFDATTLEIVGLEALVRWNHPERGLLLPGDFLDVAVDINAMSAIDRCVLERAAEAIVAWDALGIRIPRVSVNVSARRLGDEALIGSLSRLPIDPSRVSFELLESMFLDDDSVALSTTIDGLKSLGFKIEIDDFGTGHASIASLLRIKPHRLKIDRQLVRPIVASERQRHLVRSIIEIGKSQGIAICAEGVETECHAVILRDLGCDTLQGYHLARPMPADHIPQVVQARGWLAAATPDMPDGSVLRTFLRDNKITRGAVEPSKRVHRKRL